MRFRPALVPTLVALVCLVILLNLGMWQLRRHWAAQERLAEVEAALDQPPLGPADLSRPAEELAWHEAVLPGRFTGEGPQLVSGRVEFGRPGYVVVEPFQVEGGPVVLVDRGWIPAEGVAEILPQIRREEPLVLEGLLLPVDGRTDLEPRPAEGDRPAHWRMETTSRLGCETLVGPPFASIARHTGVTTPVYLTVGPALERGQAKDPSVLPVSGYIARPKNVQHLNYAGQWFLIAATLVAVWTYAGFRRGRLTAPPPT